MNNAYPANVHRLVNAQTTMHPDQFQQRLKSEAEKGLRYQLAPGATPDQIREAEKRLRLEFPTQVASFWSAFNGLQIDDPSFAMFPLAELKREGTLLVFCICDGKTSLGFDVGIRNEADQWSIVNAETGYRITLTMSSFWSTHLWKWLLRRRPIWQDIHPSNGKSKSCEEDQPKIEWLTLDQVKDRRFQVFGTPSPQQITLPADVKKLPQDIPTEANFLEMGDVPGPSFQWYCLIGGRPVILELEKYLHAGERVIVHTSFPRKQEKSGDWTVLQDLMVLPGSINVSRPDFIMSRTSNPAHVVFRLQTAGWYSPIYHAASLAEAEALLRFLKQHPGNGDCLIGPPEPEGHWSAVRTDTGIIQVLCSYPSRNAALTFACNHSAKAPDQTLIVLDRSNASHDQYVISQGRVLYQK